MTHRTNKTLYLFMLFCLLLAAPVAAAVKKPAGEVVRAPAPVYNDEDQRRDLPVPPSDPANWQPVSRRLPADAHIIHIGPDQSASIGSGLGIAKATIFQEGFEANLDPGTWSFYRPTGSPDVQWGRSTYRKATGSYSAWCAQNGAASPGAGGDVPVNTETWIIAGPFDLSTVTAGTISFDLWLETEASYDPLQYMASTNGTNFFGWQTSQNTSGFETFTSDLGNYASNDLTGEPQVWFAWIYISDVSTRFEGAYIDNISVVGDGGGTPGVYVLTDDNDNNAWGGTADGDWNYCLFNTDNLHPIEFHIDVTETNITSAQLFLLCNDVDEDTEPNNPEEDEVYINNNYLGNLRGANNEDSTTVFNVNPAFLVAGGRNRVQILVNQGAAADPGDWCVELKRAQLAINGASGGRADCRYVETDKANYDWSETVHITYDIDTTATNQEIRVETNIISPASTIVAGSDAVFVISGGANDPRNVDLVLPGSGDAGQYTVQVLVFDNATGEYESTCTTPITIGGGGTAGVYVIEDDNDNNAWGGTADGDWHYCLFNTDALHPIEFHIDISETNITSAQLLLLCNDVDEDTNASNPEVDEVYVNGNYVGTLTGANNEDSTTVFTVNPSYLVPGGRNRVTILVNQGAAADPGDWCVELKKAQLIVNGASSGRTSCRYVTTDMSTYAWGDTVQVTYDIDTILATQSIRVETNIIAPNSNILAGSDAVYTINGAADDPRNVNLNLPASGVDGVYTVQVLVFDTFTGEFESMCTTLITIGAGGGAYITYLPHFAEEVGAWLTELTLANGTATAQYVTIMLYGDDGTLHGTTGFSLLPFGSVTEPISTYFPTLNVPFGWLKIITNSDCVKGLMRFTYLPAGGVSTLPTVDITSTRLIFPMMETTVIWNSAFAVVNTTDTTANMTAYAYAPDGTLLATASGLQVPPNGKYVNYLTSTFSVALPPQVMLIVECDQMVTGFALALNGNISKIVAVPASLCGLVLK
ncbi:MAG: hypothetical protein JXQ27_08840 [Acidobacteria bacterium]|nr:hypothetical protein [Acidobacteriota bacterium]